MHTAAIKLAEMVSLTHQNCIAENIPNKENIPIRESVDRLPHNCKWKVNHLGEG